MLTLESWTWKIGENLNRPLNIELVRNVENCMLYVKG
jgi:hypothetical protein